MGFALPASVTINNSRLAGTYYLLMLIIVTSAVLLVIFVPSLTYCRYEVVRTSSAINIEYPKDLDNVIGKIDEAVCFNTFLEIPWEKPNAACKHVCEFSEMGINDNCMPHGDLFFQATKSTLDVYVSELEMLPMLRPDITRGHFQIPFVLSHVELMEIGITVSYEQHREGENSPPAAGIILVNTQHQVAATSNTNFIKLRLSDIFAAMHGMPSDLQVGGTQIKYRSSAQNAEFPPAVRALGAEVSVHADCLFSTKELSKELNEVDPPLEPKDGAPVCLLYFNWVPPASSKWPTVVSTHPDLLTVRSVIRITQSAGLGHQCRFRWDVLVTFVAVFFTVLQYPKYFVRFIAVNLLGQLSTVYGRVLLKPFSISAAFAQLGARLICASASYVDLIDWDQIKKEGPKREGVPSWRIRERLRKAFGEEFAQLKEEHVDRFIMMCHWGSEIGQMQSDRDVDVTLNSDHLMNCKAFCSACTADEVVDFHDVVDLCDERRQRGFLEKCFTPYHLRSFINASMVVGEYREHFDSIEEEKLQEHHALMHVMDQHEILKNKSEQLIPQLEHLKSFQSADSRSLANVRRSATSRSSIQAESDVRSNPGRQTPKHEQAINTVLALGKNR